MYEEGLSLWATPWAAVSIAWLITCCVRISYSDFTAGARQVATGFSIAKDTGGKIFVTSMCMGSGMGMASIFVSEQ
jgi:Thiolase, C-terminal domain